MFNFGEAIDKLIQDIKDGYDTSKKLVFQQDGIQIILMATTEEDEMIMINEGEKE